MNRSGQRPSFGAIGFLFAVVMLLVSVAGLAQQDLPPVNSADMLRDLDQLEKKRTESVKALKSKAVTTLQPGAANGQAASKLFADAVEATRLDGRGSNAMEVAEWNKKNADLLRSREMQDALQFHLRYLVMALQRSDAPDGAKFAAPSFAYARDVADYMARADKSGKMPREAREILDAPLARSPFVQWLSLGPWLPPAEVWEPAPANIEKILEKNVRAAWRAERKPELLQTWDFQLQFEADRATLSGSEHTAAQFNTMRRPQLIFARAQDAALTGQTNRGARDIFELLQKYPGHPDFDQWAKALRRLLEPESNPPGGG